MSLAWRTSSNLTEGRWGPTWIKGGINLLEKARWDQVNQVQVWHLSIRYGYNGYNPNYNPNCEYKELHIAFSLARSDHGRLNNPPSSVPLTPTPVQWPILWAQGTTYNHWTRHSTSILSHSWWITVNLLIVQPQFGPSIHRTMEQEIEMWKTGKHTMNVDHFNGKTWAFPWFSTSILVLPMFTLGNLLNKTSATTKACSTRTAWPAPPGVTGPTTPTRLCARKRISPRNRWEVCGRVSMA